MLYRLRGEIVEMKRLTAAERSIRDSARKALVDVLGPKSKRKKPEELAAMFKAKFGPHAKEPRDDPEP
jgi:hypothetical protein